MKGGCDLNALTQLLQIQAPILQGGMGNISHAELTAAVSNAGGLGTLGVGTRSPAEVEKQLIRTKELTHRPFAVNIPISVQPHLKEIGRMVIDYQVPVVSLSAGNPEPIIEKLKPHGIKIICVIASVRHAIKAWQAGADVIVAEGYEAAGLNAASETTTMVLIPQIADSVEAPIVAAGGIADSRGLMAAMALGASGVQLGTRLIATQEARVHDLYKQAVIQSGDTDTVIVGRTFGRPRRILNTPYAKQLLEWEKESVPLDQFLEYTDEDRHIIGAIQGQLDKGHVNCGQVGGLVKDLPTVESVIQQMTQGMKSTMEQIRKRSGF
jgi:enoyl-[acyl-carrier protein] reductase II